jgi:hypothetical protein
MSEDMMKFHEMTKRIPAAQFLQPQGLEGGVENGSRNKCLAGA